MLQEKICSQVPKEKCENVPINKCQEKPVSVGETVPSRPDISRLYGIKPLYNRYFPCMEVTHPYAIKIQ